MAIGSPQWMYASGEAYELEQSLKFNDDDSAYLSWTPSSAGNQKTWTWSGWVKRGNLDTEQVIFGGGTSGTNNCLIRFNSDNTLRFHNYASSFQWNLTTSAVYRDTSSWYNIIAVADTSNGTSGDRVRLYVNGQRVTAFGTETYPSQNYDGLINSSIEHTLAKYPSASSYQDGYLSEVNFIDGQALTPADFGETGDYGEWKPIEYSGTYGTNGFYLPFKQDYTVEGFSTVTYKGNNTAGHYIGGVGFKPDFVWTKKRNGSNSHRLVDAVRGATKTLMSDDTGAEYTENSVTSFETDGFTVGTGNSNNDGGTYVAWNWDMGGSNATNTNGSITSTVRANPTYGQSIVSYTGNATAGATVGHGLSSAPEMIIIKNRESVKDWIVYHEGIDASSPENYRITLNATTAREDETNNGWNDTAPTSSVFSLGSGTRLNESVKDHIAYCFHSVTGYSKFGSYTGNGSTTGTSVTLGFKPAFVLIRKTNGGADWLIFDNTRNPTNEVRSFLEPNTSDAEATEQTTNYELGIDFDSNGFQIKARGGGMNGNGDNYIYMAFADKREYAYWLDQSGNNNDWTSNNLTESDISVDSPTNNFATGNPLAKWGWTDNVGIPTYSEGNLKVQATSNQVQTAKVSFTMAGKMYFETLILTQQYQVIGIGEEFYGGQSGVNDNSNNAVDGVNVYVNAGTEYSTQRVNGTETSTNISSTFSVNAGDIVQFAYDADTGKAWFGVNNTWYGSGNPSTGANPKCTFPVSTRGNMQPAGTDYGTGNGWVFNFGQDSSFAGNKTAQGNQDGNDIGDFYYTPPTGFLALCTKNLPDVDVVPSEHFNTVLYTGNNGASLAVSGVGFQPDFTWIKERSSTSHHFLMDAVRGATKFLQSSTTIAEVDNSDVLQSFDSDGFTVGTSGGTNASDTYASWNWKANGSGSSNTDGTITSTVSANVDAGFSIVTYTGTGTNGSTIGHGLSKAPDIVIVKSRNTSGGWYANVKNIPSQSAGTDMVGVLNSNVALNGYNVGQWYFASTAPNASTFTVQGVASVGANNDTHVAYCFHSVDGYSKVGSYTGNGSTDGTFVYTGFRPAMVFMKNTGATEQWFIFDNERPSYNQTSLELYPSASTAESSATSNALDFVSNGFKMRGSDTGTNNGSYIYIAFAETPFKYSNAR